MESRTEECKERSEYVKRGQWIRAAVLGANDGLVSTASMMMGVGAVKSDAKTMLLTGLAALVAGALSMAIGEFVSVCTQRDVESSGFRNDVELASPGTKADETEYEDNESLPNPWQAAFASSASFALGAAVPLLSASFIRNYLVRVCVVGGTSMVSLAMFGGLGAYYGGASFFKGALRVVIGGCIAMLLTFGIFKLVGVRMLI